MQKKRRKKQKEKKELSSQHFTPYRKINLKWTVYLNVRAKTIKLLEENIGENIYDLELGKNFLAGTQKAQIIKGKYL